jgi:hypothetical protein
MTPPSPDTVALVEGLTFFEKGEYDLARERLMVSALSKSTYIRTESFLYLNALEMELANYDAARPWLDRYHLETVRLLRSSAEESRRVAEQTARLRRRQDLFIGGVLMVLAAVVAGGMFLAKRSRPSPSAGTTPPPQEEKEGDNFPLPEWRTWLVDAEIFKQTPIWAEVSALAAQPSGRDAKVLPTARQEVLDAELAERFADFGGTLRSGWPSLTAGDVKLCSLSLLPLTPFARALCFGSTETNIVKQRKHTVKKTGAAAARARALFAITVAPRG